MSAARHRLDPTALAMGLAFSVMWSSAFATARVIVADASPLWALTIRFALSGLIAVLVARALGQSWRLTRPIALSVLIFGLCQNALYLGLNFVALQWVEASIASIIASSMPLIVAALGWVLGREKVPPLGQLGLALGFAGVALIMGTRVSGGADPIGIVLCVMGATGLAVATLTVRSVSSGGNLLMVVGLQMWVGSAALGLCAVLTEPWAVTPSLPLLFAFLYQIFIPGLTATILWFALVKRVGAVRASTFHFMNPFFGVTLSALLLGETISKTDIAGVLIAMAGILAVQLSRLKPPAPPDPQP
ncbi:MAG: DMT family transporter [Tabrizicola sp.]|nr:DMT family transporter [Tabrizicola sp.]